MELSQLQYFMEAAQSQHITRSAEKLHIAQPALTRAIQRLEAELEVPLFVRKGRGIILTEYGRVLQKRLLPVMETLDQLPGELRSLTNIESRSIRINVLAASTMITSAVIEYKKNNPDVLFHMIQKEEMPDCDISVNTKLFFQHSGPNLQNEFVCAEHIFLAVPNVPPYEGLKKIKLSEVAEEGFIVLSGSRTFRSICDSFCHHAGFRPRIYFESDSPDAVRNMIAANMGVGFWPEFTWGKLGSADVLLLEIEDPLCTRDLIFTRHITGSNDKMATDFFNFLSLYCEKAKNMSAH